MHRNALPSFLLLKMHQHQNKSSKVKLQHTFSQGCWNPQVWQAHRILQDWLNPGSKCLKYDHVCIVMIGNNIWYMLLRWQIYDIHWLIYMNMMSHDIGWYYKFLYTLTIHDKLRVLLHLSSALLLQTPLLLRGPPWSPGFKRKLHLSKDALQLDHFRLA